jgi:hypothetical protein
MSFLMLLRWITTAAKDIYFNAQACRRQKIAPK